MEKIDLHIHSNLSDGDLNIDDIIKLSKENNCKKIAITDHERAVNYNSFNNEEIEIINGIEFNSTIDRMHFLGYGFSDFDLLNHILNNLNRDNEIVCFKLIEELNKAGFEITYTKVRNYIESLGINSDILDKRKIVKYLIHKGYYKDVLSVYNNLIGKGQTYYIPNCKLTPKEIIDLINASGGVSVLAHPATLKLNELDLLNTIKELVEIGLDGIEIINRKLDIDKYNLYKDIAIKNNMLYTVGSDFHSLKQGNIGIETEDDIFDNLKNKIECKKLKKMI